jgi:thiol-disulfide isomerase/thioredoxin
MVAALALVLSAVVAVVWNRSNTTAVAKIGPDPSGKTLHNYKLTALDGSTVTLDHYRGKPLVVNFWASDCAPCRQEMPAFETVANQLGSQVAIVGVNSGDSAAVTVKYRQDVGATYDILRDPKQQFAGQDVLALPTTLFVNADGKIVSTNVGAMTSAELTERIQEQLL